jgi:hypothetical protein
MATMAVTRVLVEYVCEGKRFRIEFDPGQTASIVLSEKDLPAVANKVLYKPQQPLLSQPEASKMSVKGESMPVMVSGADISGPPLWWHTTGCNWFHPE